MWTLTIRDLKFRRRRFLIAIIGTGMLFGLALTISGISAGFRFEVKRTLGVISADAWVGPAGIAGPFTTFGTMPADVVEQVAKEPGVKQADPIVLLRNTIRRNGTFLDVNVIGAVPGRLGDPTPDVGRRIAGRGEAIVDTRLGKAGGQITLQGRPFGIVGVIKNLTYLGGIPVAVIPLADAQALAYGGRPFISVVATRGVPVKVPDGYQVMSNTSASTDMLRPLLNGIKTIDQMRLMLWLVAGTIIAAVVYLSALERVRDFAVLKAIGASTASIFGSLAIQAVVVALISAALAVGVAKALGPTLPLPAVISMRDFLLLPATALVVGVIASFSGLSRVMRVDPSKAFGA